MGGGGQEPELFCVCEKEREGENKRVYIQSLLDYDINICVCTYISDTLVKPAHSHPPPPTAHTLLYTYSNYLHNVLQIVCLYGDMLTGASFIWCEGRHSHSQLTANSGHVHSDDHKVLHSC